MPKNKVVFRLEENKQGRPIFGKLISIHHHLDNYFGDQLLVFFDRYIVRYETNEHYEKSRAALF